MFGSDRHGYITFGWVATILIALLAGSIYHSKYTRIQESSQYADRCAQQHQELVSSLNSTSGNEEARNSNQNNEGKPDWCDLAAQHSMAESTRGIHWAAWATVAFTGFGAFLIWQTLLATQQTVEVTREVGESQTRAYVIQEKIHWDRIANSHGETVCWRFYVGWKNAGKTPALNFVKHTNWMIFTELVDENFDFRDHGDRWPDSGHVGPSGYSNSPIFEISVNQARAIAEGKIHLLVYGWCEYDDVFPNSPRRRTEFATYVNFLGPADGKDTTLRFTGTRSYQGIDNQCEGRFRTIKKNS